MRSFLARLFLGNGVKLAGWLPLTVVKTVSVLLATTIFATSGYLIVNNVIGGRQANNQPVSTPVPTGLKLDGSAQDGTGDGSTKESIQKDLDNKVASSMFAISINTNPVFPTAKSEGNLNIINSPSNTYLMVVEIYTSDNVLIYKSDAIKPNQHIEKAKLTKYLAKGEHAATAYFLAYTQDKQGYVGKAGAKIKINILE